MVTYRIQTRDRHAAASLGRPMRIKDEDCDIEMLNEGDFLVDQDFDIELLGDQHDFHVMYAIEMSKLAVICEYRCYNLPGVNNMDHFAKT